MSDTVTETTEQNATPGQPVLPNGNMNIAITMSAYEWTKLLDQLWNNLRVCNQDNTYNVFFYEKIATILNNGNEIHILHRDNPDPKYRPAEEKAAPAPVEPTKCKGFFATLFGK